MNGEITGRARLGRRTKDLVKRLGPQDVAIVDHADIDRVSAEELAESGVRAVVNISRSSTGRFPNPGPLELVRAGVRLVDAPGAPLFDELTAVADAEGKAGDVTWNFEKWLVSKDGEAVGRFRPQVTPSDPVLREAIDKLV